MVPSTRSAWAIDGGEDGDGTRQTAKPMKSRVKWSLEVELREEKA